MKNPKPQFANDAGRNRTLFGFINEIQIGDDGWMMVAPFGDHPSEALMPGPDGKLKRVKAIQRITKANADKMVAEFHNSRVGLKKFVVGKLIFVGHPDVPGLENRYLDKSPKGLYADFEVREDGLYGRPIFNNEGEPLMAHKKFRAVSGRFGESEPDGTLRSATGEELPVYCPTQIISVGLTNNPHLPVHFFNSDDTLVEADAETGNNKTKNTMKKKLIAVCGLLGIQFANEAADDAQTEAALDQVQAKVTEFANEKQVLTDKVTALETDKTKLAGDLTAAQAATTAAQTEFANERTARINDVVAAKIVAGVITGAEEADWKRRLAVPAQFANEMTALNKLTPKVKTTTLTVNHGGKERQVNLADAPSRTQFVNEVLADIAVEHKLNPTHDSKRILNLAHQRHPALFADVPHVEIKMPGGKK